MLDDPTAHWTQRERTWRIAMFLVPFLLYIPMLSFDFTIGDGPELLVAMHNWGGAHPSGYPLMMLLGHWPAVFPLGTPNFNVSLVLSALPSALTAMLLFMTARELGARRPASALGALCYALNVRVVYQSTRVEVYALHCMLLAFTLYALMQYRRTDDEATTLDFRWIFIATASVCIGLTNHLTSVFLVPIVVVHALWLGPKELLQPKRIAILLAIAAACASAYLYLPIHAMYSGARTISWNDPQTFELFVYHVTGEEYSGFRKTPDLLTGGRKLTKDFSNSLFPGILILSLFGIVELLISRWRIAALVSLLAGMIFVYVSSYTINDIATYYTPLYYLALLTAALGVDWLLEARFGEVPEGVMMWVQRVVYVGVVIGLCAMYWLNRGEGYREGYGEAMSDQAVAQMPEKAIVFTLVDRHTFSMWYQAYVKRPDRELVVIDQGMFGLDNKRWYRDFLRARHPEVNWPTEEEAKKGGWVRKIVDRNHEEYGHFAFPWHPWRVAGTKNVNRGWVHEIYPSHKLKKVSGHFDIRYSYLARHDRMNNRHVFHSSSRSFARGDKIACMVEWLEHTKTYGTWTFEGPNGAKVTFPKHDVPANVNMSWESLEPEDQVPGAWTCTVQIPGKDPLVLDFEITE